MLYELLEWAVAVLFGGDLGTAYLGTQGDEWDAHRDMALAMFGAVLSMSTTAVINWKYSRRFGEEWWESLTIKERRPLGEIRLREMLEESRGGPPASGEERQPDRAAPGQEEEDRS
jgi:putative membrane protein